MTVFKASIKKVIRVIRSRMPRQRYPFSRVVMYEKIEQQLQASHAGGLVLEVGAVRAGPRKGQWYTVDSRHILMNLDAAQDPNVVMDANAMAFRENTFDVVEIDQVLEHVPNPSRVLSEAYRVLKHGGTVIIGTPFMMQIHSSPDDYWRFSESGLRILLEQAMFKGITTDSWGHEQAVAAHMRYFWHGVRTRRALRKLLERDPDKRFPLHCWAIATKDQCNREA